MITDHETLFRRIRRGKIARGHRFIYHTGETTWDIQRNPVAREVYKLYQEGLVHLFQEIVSDEPRVYNYIGVVK